MNDVEKAFRMRFIRKRRKPKRKRLWNLNPKFKWHDHTPWLVATPLRDSHYHVYRSRKPLEIGRRFYKDIMKRNAAYRFRVGS